jgi:ribosomal protein S18 acetylase RimI-like enzyme
MSSLRLRPMTDAEFAAFRARAIHDYALEKVAADEWPLERAEALAEEQTDALLPDGKSTEGMFIVMADADEVGPVGYAWLALQGPDVSSAWIHDIAIDDEQRGKGYGRALLTGLEQVAREHGLESIALNVFASNDYARRLYERAGFKPTSIRMAKRLDEEPT